MFCLLVVFVYGVNIDVQLPRYTLVFDREGYSPQFFGDIWQEHQVAVITYRKNVKNLWDEVGFVDYEIETELGTSTMPLQEKEIELDGVSMREIRKLSIDGHQTSVITTNRKLSSFLLPSTCLPVGPKRIFSGI